MLTASAYFAAVWTVYANSTILKLRGLRIGSGLHAVLSRYCNFHGICRPGLCGRNLPLGHRSQSVDIFHQSPHDFCHAPGLCHAPTMPLRSVAVENLLDVAKPTIRKVIL